MLHMPTVSTANDHPPVDDRFDQKVCSALQLDVVKLVRKFAQID